MAKRDVPPGWQYDAKTRGAFNPQTGEYLSRGKLEAPRIAREENLSSIKNPFERKAAQRAQQLPTPITPVLRGQTLGKARREGLVPMPPPKPHLPRRLKVHYKGRTQQRILVENQERYRVKTFSDIFPVVANLPPDTSLYIRMYGRNPYGQGSPRFKDYGKKDRLRWITITASKFRADEIQEHFEEMIDYTMYFYDIRAFDIITTIPTF